MLPPLRLKKNEDRRLRAGHLWVFSNEVDVARTPLTAFEPGQPVAVEDHRGAPLGAAYVNPRSLIAARLVGRDPARPLDGALLRERLARALALRERLFPGPFYRLAFGEGDGLPGLVVDRFGGVLVAQLTTAGMERLRGEVVAALAETARPAGILLRNDVPGRTLEGLEPYVEVAHGEVPERAELEENGVRFRAPVSGGQKTGWFYDHRMNRARMQAYAPGRRVLDVFSYVGGWGVQAAAAGAAEVLCVDSSEPALAAARENADSNGVGERVRTRRGDAFDVLRALAEEGERFDVVVLDPPAFIKRKKDQKAGEEAYRRLAQHGMQVLAPDGILVSASCSYHMSREALHDALLRAGRRLGRDLQLLEEGMQGPDHPVHPAIPETRYLKAFVARVA
ncbi:MAG TPA: class I SAM-dependent rRNA methyltransferase [Longimicrobiaceae bacterium]|nr:class I SAM-dependent rRNA methyltransferase [Longimicrobiaceae bacterium]